MNMRCIEIGVLSVLLWTLGGCASTPPEQQPTANDAVEAMQDDVLAESLQDAAKDVTHAMRVLSETRNAQVTETLSPEARMRAIGDATFTPPRMGQKATLQWNGPLDQVVERIASLSKYSVKVFGTPKKAVIVRLDYVNAPLVEILRDARYQAGEQAEINVYPGKSEIQIVYSQGT